MGYGVSSFIELGSYGLGGIVLRCRVSDGESLCFFFVLLDHYIHRCHNYATVGKVASVATHVQSHSKSSRTPAGIVTMCCLCHGTRRGARTFGMRLYPNSIPHTRVTDL